MHVKSLLFAHAGVLALTAAIYLAGLEFFLFWRLWWFDILLHFLGGVWAALASAWVIALLRIPLSTRSVLLSVLAVGVGWEVLEYVLNFPREEAYALDLATDIVLDMLGGVVGARIALALRP
jgi:hypothetical protein